MTTDAVKMIQLIKLEPIIKYVLDKLEGHEVYVLQYPFGGVDFLPTLRGALELGLREYRKEAARYLGKCPARDHVEIQINRFTKALNDLNAQEGVQ